MNILKSVKVHFARTGTLFIAILLTAIIAPQILNIKTAAADDGGYPWVGATQLFTSTNVTYDWGYSTCPSNAPGCMGIKMTWNGTVYGEEDPYTMEFRNCTSYAAWKINQYISQSFSGWGNASSWYTKAPAADVHAASGYTPVFGDLALWNSAARGLGHVAFVSSVDSNGIASLDEYNSGLPKDSNGNLQWGLFYSGRTTASNSANTPDYYIHFNGISSGGSGGTTNPNPIHISAIHTGGGAEAKEGSVSAGWWALSSNSATQVMEDGTLNGLVWNGQLLVNQGHPTNNWIVLDASGSVTQASISDSDGTTPIRIGLLRNDGTFWVTEGLSGSSWTLEQGGVVAGYVSGNRIAVLLSDGTFEVKEGGLGAGWVVEDGSVSQGIISGGSNGSGLIGVVIGGTLLVKVGGLGAGWVTENGAVANAQLSYRTGQTPDRISYIDTGGSYWVKEGISGGWVLEQGGVTNAAISGNLIGVVMSDGTYQVKQGGLSAGWVTEDGLITQNTLWSGN